MNWSESIDSDEMFGICLKIFNNANGVLIIQSVLIHKLFILLKLIIVFNVSICLLVRKVLTWLEDYCSNDSEAT